LIKRCQFGK